MFDAAIAAAVLMLSAPVTSVAALGVRISMGSPVLWYHDRPGRDGRPFRMYKLRTMRQPQPGEEWLKTDRARLTPFGKALRKTSIDELPSLWNVLKGNMSIVGPRPLLMDYLPRYTERQLHRMDVRPGITGWAQVNGRQNIPLSERVELDLWYIENRSTQLDLKIIWMTLRQAVVGHGVISGQDPHLIDDLRVPNG
ncbi:MAG TPA: sugar transferase [Mycobacterium sp.]